jgi:UDP-N-acetylmuramoyl-L-alanyl-D-glutamate--2,6-diaminopimelate ligase
MRLDQLLAGETSVNPDISSLAYDSRRVRPGALFFCVPGFHSDGHDHAADAVAAGAVALVVERGLGLGVPEVLVKSVRETMGLFAARFYGDPTAELRVVGITGTNGKTTSAYLVRALIEAAGERCGLLGTVKSVIAGEDRPAGRTTPEAIDLQADFRAMLDGGETACAMEVSSHALALGRTAGVRFAAAVFTNLTQDHLDFHPTMDDYFKAKRRLFLGAAEGSDGEGSDGEGTDGEGSEGEGSDGEGSDGEGAGGKRPSEEKCDGKSIGGRPGVSVVNVADPYGRRLADELPGAVTFAVEREADYSAHELRCDFAGSRFVLRAPEGEREVRLPLPGRFNVANALGALASVQALGGDLDTGVAALERGVRVPGRFESIDEGQRFAAIVDYAHTPDSLENVLATARELAQSRQGRVLCVFGAGGDRDAAKRPLMGEAAGRLADVAIVTSDNPRSEDPEAIVAQVLAGAVTARRSATAKAVQSEVDRRRAIERAIEQAEPGDVVVIAGKGHEQGQELAGGLKVPFDDAQVAREALRARISTKAGAQAEPGPGTRVG